MAVELLLWLPAGLLPPQPFLAAKSQHWDQQVLAEMTGCQWPSPETLAVQAALVTAAADPAALVAADPGALEGAAVADPAAVAGAVADLAALAGAAEATDPAALAGASAAGPAALRGVTAAGPAALEVSAAGPAALEAEIEGTLLALGMAAPCCTEGGGKTEHAEADVKFKAKQAEADAYFSNLEAVISRWCGYYSEMVEELAK